MASTLQIIFAAGRLRLLVGGDVDLSDGAVLARATELLSEFSPSERQTVAAKAVELGADAAVVQALLDLVAGEVIEVSGRAPRRWPWWAWLAIGTTAAAAVGGLAGYRARRGGGGRPVSGEPLGLTRPQKDALARVVADYKDVVRTRGGYADPGEFRRRVRAAGLELETLRFDLTKRADLNRLRELYDLDAKAFKRLQQAAKEADAPTYELMVTDDGMAIDWTANRIKLGAQAPYVFWIEGFEAVQTSTAPALPPPPPTSTPVRQTPSELILKAARAVGPEGRWSDDKVFIAAAHKALLRSGINMSLADFKRQLVKMLARGEVVLMRSDLPGAMSNEQQALDAESEIDSMGALFNFIYLPERSFR